MLKVLPVLVLLCQILLLLKNAAWDVTAGLTMEEAACSALVFLVSNTPTGTTCNQLTGGEGCVFQVSRFLPSTDIANKSELVLEATVIRDSDRIKNSDVSLQLMFVPPPDPITDDDDDVWQF